MRDGLFSDGIDHMSLSRGVRVALPGTARFLTKESTKTNTEQSTYEAEHKPENQR